MTVIFGKGCKTGLIVAVCRTVSEMVFPVKATYCGHRLFDTRLARS